MVPDLMITIFQNILIKKDGPYERMRVESNAQNVTKENNMPYHSEAAKVRDMSIMKYVHGRVCDVGAGGDKITPDAYAVDGRALPGVDSVRHGLFLRDEDGLFDTIFSSHFLEHVDNPSDYISNWFIYLRDGGHLVLYLPQKDAYNSHENLEHLFNWSYDDFMFWFKRSFCGEGKNYLGEHILKYFEVVESGLDIAPDRYSFYLVARKV
jgi:SAM-dependent methyltransferase